MVGKSQFEKRSVISGTGTMVVAMGLSSGERASGFHMCLLVHVMRHVSHDVSLKKGSIMQCNFILCSYTAM